MGNAAQKSATEYLTWETGLWVLHPFASGETVTLASVTLEISAAQLFAEVA